MPNPFSINLKLIPPSTGNDHFRYSLEGSGLGLPCELMSVFYLKASESRICCTEALSPEDSIYENSALVASWIKKEIETDGEDFNSPISDFILKTKMISRKQSDSSTIIHPDWEDGSNKIKGEDNSNIEALRREQFSIVAAIYKGIHLFLQSEDRFITYDARFAYLLSTWLWFNALKLLYEYDSKNKIAISRRFFIDDIAAANRSLYSMVKSPEFAQALRWMSEWIPDVYLDGPRFREKLIISLPLIHKKKSIIDGFIEEYLLSKYYFENFYWKYYEISQAFCGFGGRAFIQSLITSFTLPRYDFETTLCLAHLIHNNKEIKRGGITWKSIGLISALTLIILAVGSFVARLLFERNGIMNQTGFLLICIGESMLFISGLLGLAIWWMGKEILPYLALPRLMGGIILGYLAFILQDSSNSLVNTLWSQGVSIPLLFFFSILVIGGMYLYLDVKPWVREPPYFQNEKGKIIHFFKSEVFQRTIWALSVALFSSILVGLYAVGLSTATASASVCTLTSCFVGPAGWVNFHQFVILVPAALFTGLATQFIFEANTITTSVWAPEEV